jgi:hypothetical protein
MSIRTLFVLALLAPLPACEEAFGPDRREVSRVFLEYTALGGMPAGTYDAAGEAPIESGGGLQPGEWAFASRSGPAPEPVLIDASRPAANGGYDRVSIVLPNGAHAGQLLTMGQPCEDPAGCAPMSVDFGFRAATLQADTRCAVRSGTLHLVTLTDERVVGTITGTLACSGAHSGQSQIRGTFDVAMRTW